MARILIIDDDTPVRTTLRRVLERDAHVVLEAPNGKEALKVVEREPCELVITDINMPEMDGIELIVTLVERWPSLPIIAISGGGKLPKDVLLLDADLLGAVTTLPKPFDLSQLKAAVDQALARPGSGGDSTPAD